MSNRKTKEKTIDETETIRVVEEESAVESMTDGNHSELSLLHRMQVNVSSRSDANNESESDPEGINSTGKASSGVINDGSALPALPTNIELSRDHKRTLLLARLASFVNGASFACHISLLPIQVTSLVDLDGESFHRRLSLN
jgi:hypothetical protein